LVWYNPNKFNLTLATAFEEPPASRGSNYVCNPGVQGEIVALPDGTLHNAGCYDRCVYTAGLQEIMAGAGVGISNNNDVLTARSKLLVNNTEEVRVTAPGSDREIIEDRIIVSTFVYEIKLPLVTTGTTTDITGFFPPNRLALITLQSVTVNVENLQPAGTVLIRTQYQWPFKFAPGTTLAVQAQNGIATTATLLTDCADPGIAANTGRDGTNVAPCDQIWRISLTPSVTNPQQCQLDGTYTITGFQITCQPAFGTDCAAVDETAQIQFTLDSENFCPNLLEDVQISATLEAFNDAALTDNSRNFLQDDMIYFKAVVTSNQVTIESATLRTMSVTFDSTGAADRRLQFDAAAAPPLSADVQALNTADGLASATELSFEFQLTDGPFDLPVDGSHEFAVDVEIDVTYVGVSATNPLLLEERRVLLQASSGPAASARARANGAVAALDDGASSASTVGGATAAALVAAAALFA
jgi:hypothetical protein